MSETVYNVKEVVGAHTEKDVAEAVQFDGTIDHARHIRYWVQNYGGVASIQNWELHVKTVRDTEEVKAGQWLVRSRGKKYMIIDELIFHELFRIL